MAVFNNYDNLIIVMFLLIISVYEQTEILRYILWIMIGPKFKGHMDQPQ